MKSLLLLSSCLLLFSGCRFMPTVARQPTMHNPVPQLSRVAIAPFRNHSAEASVNGRQFALAYFNELQSVPGFEVVPVGRTEAKMRELGITLASAEEARLLAQALEVDAVVVGAVTDFTPYYPPRVGLQVEWYAANPGFHPIPPGYGLPWGTPEEEQIPGPLIFEAQMALAREQLKTQEPAFRPASPLPAPNQPRPLPPAERTVKNGSKSVYDRGVKQVNHTQTTPAELPAPGSQNAQPADGKTPDATNVTDLPFDWPDPRGFSPSLPQATRPEAIISREPVMRHTRTYNGHDPHVTTALENYYFFRDDARFGGWQSYLQRSDDYVRFCCHMHVAELLTARGGAGESRVVWRWPGSR